MDTKLPSAESTFHTADPLQTLCSLRGGYKVLPPTNIYFFRSEMPRVMRVLHVSSCRGIQKNFRNCTGEGG